MAEFSDTDRHVHVDARGMLVCTVRLCGRVLYPIGQHDAHPVCLLLDGHSGPHARPVPPFVKVLRLRDRNPESVIDVRAGEVSSFEVLVPRDRVGDAPQPRVEVFADVDVQPTKLGATPELSSRAGTFVLTED